MSSQHDGLCHETKAGLDGLEANLLVLPVASSSNPSGEAQESLLLDGSREGSEIRVKVAFGGVLGPIFPGRSSGGVVHCRSGNREPRSVKITRESSSGSGFTRVQQVVCGKGKRFSKYVRNISSGNKFPARVGKRPCEMRHLPAHCPDRRWISPLPVQIVGYVGAWPWHEQVGEPPSTWPDMPCEWTTKPPGCCHCDRAEYREYRTIQRRRSSS